MKISEQRRLTLIERAERNTDWAAVERRKRERAKREKAERIAHLRRLLFDPRIRSHDPTESDAAAHLIVAHECADDRAVLGILHTAIDNQWHHAVRAGIRHFGEGPTAAALRDIYEYSLTTDQTSA